MQQKGIGTLLGAFSFTARVRGLFAWKHTDKTLMLAPCRSIHTFGMKHAIDVAFVDRDGEVIKVVKAVPPRSRISCRGACAVYERLSCPDAWFEEGDELVIGAKSAELA